MFGEGSLDGTYETASLILTGSFRTYHESQWNSGFENGPAATPISVLWQKSPPLCGTVEIRCASSPLFLPSSSDLRAFCCRSSRKPPTGMGARLVFRRQRFSLDAKIACYWVKAEAQCVHVRKCKQLPLVPSHLIYLRTFSKCRPTAPRPGTTTTFPGRPRTTINVCGSNSFLAPAAVWDASPATASLAAPALCSAKALWTVPTKRHR